MFGNRKDKYYKVLGVPVNASPEQIKKAYMEKVKIWHPDRNKSPEAPKKFKEIKEAYEILTNKSKAQDDPSGGNPYGQYSNGYYHNWEGGEINLDQIFEEFMYGGRRKAEYDMKVSKARFIDINRRANLGNTSYDMSNSSFSHKDRLSNILNYTTNCILVYKTPDTVNLFDPKSNKKILYNTCLIVMAKDSSLNIEYPVYSQSREEKRSVDIYSDDILKQLKESYYKITLVGKGNYNPMNKNYEDAVIKLLIEDKNQHIQIENGDIILHMEIDYLSLYIGDTYNLFDGYHLYEFNIPINNGLNKIKIPNAGLTINGKTHNLYIKPIVYLIHENSKNIEILKTISR